MRGSVRTDAIMDRLVRDWEKVWEMRGDPGKILSCPYHKLHHLPTQSASSGHQPDDLATSARLQ
jgi:hypothetical protein